MNIQDFQSMYDNDMLFFTNHVLERIRQRGIRVLDIKNAIYVGEIIEEYIDDYPYPSCLILGMAKNSKELHVVIATNGEIAKIITAYWPDKNKWKSDFKTRKG